MQMKLIFISAKTIMLALSGLTLCAWEMLEASNWDSSNAFAVNKYEFMPFFKFKDKRWARDLF